MQAACACTTPPPPAGRQRKVIDSRGAARPPQHSSKPWTTSCRTRRGATQRTSGRFLCSHCTIPRWPPAAAPSMALSVHPSVRLSCSHYCWSSEAAKARAAQQREARNHQQHNNKTVVSRRTETQLETGGRRATQNGGNSDTLVLAPRKRELLIASYACLSVPANRPGV